MISILAASCGKQDAIYKEFLINGGRIYPAKPINVTAKQGYQRIVLRWEAPMDPSIRTAKVFWDSHTQSMEFDYANAVNGALEAVVDNLEDRSYTFDIVNYDADGNSSLEEEITTSPFGDSWLVSHAERTIKSARMSGKNAVITMGKATDEIALTKFRFLNTKGETVESGYLRSDENQIELTAAQKYKYFEYQSAYCPADGIDTVWTGNWMKSAVPISSNVDGSYSTVTVTSNQIRGSFMPRYILDGVKDSSDSRWYSSQEAAYRSKFPKILLIDTKASGDAAMTFNGFVFYQDPDPEGQTRRYIRSLSVYVSDAKFDVNDSNYLRNFGDPVAQAVLNQNEAVQEVIPAEPKAGRYIAIVFRNSYNSTGYIDLWEFEAFGYVAKETE